MKKIFLTLFYILLLVNISSAIELSCDNWEPYYYLDDGKPTGYCYDVICSVFEIMKVAPVNVNFYPWERALRMVKQSEADGVFSAVYTKDRADFCYFPTEALIKLSWVCWIRKDSDFTITKLDDLKGKSIGIAIGYEYGTNFMNYINENCKVELVSNDLLNFKKLQGKRIDVMVSDYLIGKYLLKRNPTLSDISSLTYKTSYDDVFLIFSKTRITKDFVDQFSKTLTEFKKTDKYSKIYNKYFK